MLKDITLGQYIQTESFLHKLDPRTKIISAFLFMIVLFMIKKPEGYYLIILFSVFTVLLSKIPLKYFL